MQKLPCDLLKSELTRRLSDKRDATGVWPDLFAAEMSGEIVAGNYCLRVQFADGEVWVIPFDPEANAILQSTDATKH